LSNNHFLKLKYYQNLCANMRHIAKLKVKDLMQKLKSVEEDTKIPEVIKVFEKDDTDAIAVVSKEGEFIGDIHQHDLLKLLIDPKDVSWD